MIQARVPGGDIHGTQATGAAAIQSVTPQMAYLDVIREALPRDGFFCEEISQVGFTARFGFPSTSLAST
jgi:acetolactate synthase-1/2/3 large subunit